MSTIGNHTLGKSQVERESADMYSLDIVTISQMLRSSLNSILVKFRLHITYFIIQNLYLSVPSLILFVKLCCLSVHYNVTKTWLPGRDARANLKDLD